MTGIAPTLYLQKHNLVSCYNEIFTKLIHEQPENPLLWTAKQFQTMYRLKHKKQPYLSSSVDIQTSQPPDLLKSADFNATSRDYARPWTSNSARLHKCDTRKSRQQRPMTANSSFQVFNAQRLMRDTIYQNSQKPDGVETMNIVGKVSHSMPDSGIEEEFISSKTYARKKSEKPGVVKLNDSLSDVNKVPAYVKLSSPDAYEPMKKSKQFVPIAETIDLGTVHKSKVQ